MLSRGGEKTFERHTLLTKLIDTMEAGIQVPISVDLGGVKITYKQFDSGGDYSLLEWETEAGIASPPVHIHHRTDEGFYVLSGKFDFLLDDTRMEAGPGSHLLVRKGHPHTFWNAGDEPATCLITLTPPDFAAYFVELSRGLAAVESDEAAMQVRRELSARFDIEVVGPPIHP